VQVGLGYLSMENEGAFSLLGNFGVELGYRGTIYTPSGYVDYPGFSFLIVPQFSFFDVIMSEAAVVLYMFGGSAEAEIPLGRHLGITGGIFVGQELVLCQQGASQRILTSAPSGILWVMFLFRHQKEEFPSGLPFNNLHLEEGQAIY